MLSRAALLIFVFSLVATAPQQHASAPPLVPANPRVAQLVDEAETLRVALKIDAAIARVDEAASIAEREHDALGLAIAHRLKGSTLDWAGRQDMGVPWLSRALAEFEALGHQRGIASALMALTAAAASQGQWTKAGELGARAIKILDALGDERDRTIVVLNLIRADSRSPSDREKIAAALDVATRLHDDDLRSDVLKALGGLQFGSGDYVAAKATFDEVVAVDERLGNVAGAASTHLMIGRIFRAHSDFDGALREYQRAVDMLAPTNERYTLVQAMNSTSIALWNLGRKDEAVAAVQRGLALAREADNPVLIDFMLGNLGGLLVSDGKNAQAIPILEEVLSRGPSPYIRAYRENQLAQALRQLNRNEEALPHAVEAVRISRSAGMVDQLDERIDEVSRVLTNLGRLDEALSQAREELAVIDELRHKLLPTDFLKRGFGEHAAIAYSSTIALLTRMNRGAEAFELSEQGRARAFLDLLAARESETTARNGVAAATLTSSALARPLTAAEIGAVAARLDSTLVSYWVNDTATTVWIVGPDGQPHATQLPIGRDALAKLVASTTALLHPTTSDSKAVALPARGLGLLSLSKDDRSAWRELYRTLIDPIRSKLPRAGSRLTIVPHGPLFLLAFAALQRADGRYLIEDYDLHYAPSASSLDFTGRREQAVRADAAGPWLLVGNPTLLPQVDGLPLAPLPGAAQEIAAIAALAPQGRALRLDGMKADQESLARVLETSHPAVLHFATHGFVFDDTKAEPFLVMNRRGESAATDGRLTLDEIYGLSLRSDLVVLSACRSGTGAVSSDGVAGLARGFFYAGAPSVLATHWDVPDLTTAMLMPRFYRAYRTDRQKSQSLRNAQLALLAELRAGRVFVTASGRRVALPEHPLLWAGFYLSGEP